MRRGEIRLVDLNPTVDAEPDKIRPAVIVSNDGATNAVDHAGYGVVTVVPVTSNTARMHAFQVLLPAGSCGLPPESKAHAEQVRSVATERVGRRIGRLTTDQLGQLDRALRLHLGL